MHLTFRRLIFSSLFVWFLITVIGVYFLINLKQYIRFGIDLAGGTYITLEVDVQKAYEAEILSAMQGLVQKTSKSGKQAPQISFKTDENNLDNKTSDIGILTFASEQDAAEAQQVFAQEQEDIQVKLVNNILEFSLSQSAKNKIRKAALINTKEVLDNRLDAHKVAEISVVVKGDRHIVVEIPQEDDIQRAKARIGKAAVLEIKPVFVDELSGNYSFSNKEAILDTYGGVLPENTMIVPSRDNRYYLVPLYADITGKYLKEVTITNQAGRWHSDPGVIINFNKEGSQKFAQLSRAYLKKPAAIILDNIVISAPTIDSVIEDGVAVISGSFTVESARELQLLLKSGSFIAPVKFEEERTIGPSLGAESIRSGLISCMIGLGLLAIFSILFYKVAGIFAVIVLVYNLLLILFMLAALGGTLTLPGIAGMVLTVGMAIDASILIYERIKEELANGKSMRQAVDLGFSGAMTIILDANITHFLVAVVLYTFGAGPIKGFAVTMIIGIISTLVTGLLLLRSIFNFVLDTLGIQKIKI